MADDEMRDEYDFCSVRGKYAARYAEGTNIVVLGRIGIARGRQGKELVSRAGRPHSRIAQSDMDRGQGQ